MTTWQTILALSICCAVTMATSDLFFDTLSNKVQKKLTMVMNNLGIDGAVDPFGDFVDDIEDMINGIRSQDFGGIDVPDADDVGKMFDKSMDVLEKSKRSGGGKNKRLMKEISEKAGEGITVVGTAVKSMMTKLKPMRDKATDFALDIQKSVDKAADKFLDAVVAVG